MTVFTGLGHQLWPVVLAQFVVGWFMAFETLDLGMVTLDGETGAEVVVKLDRLFPISKTVAGLTFS